ncbi:MAG TPA: alpha/beta hydrolase [Pyrinomonadaceae bacterium]|jgi:pimeloyl-ACP methyl ester carboxylesterase|nr:alpha/beta hydrolase [Pyrinomonadaceae bacterium]
MLGWAEKAEVELEAGAFVEVEGVRLHYLSRGEGRPVVLLHGNSGFAHDFAAVLEAIDAGEFRALAFDRPGHGLSERPPQDGAMSSQARLLRGALAALGVRRPLLVGHSWGGALALSYALQFAEEVAALVLLAPAAYQDEDETYAAQRILVEIPVLSDLFIRASDAFIRGEIKRNLERAFSPDQLPLEYLRAAESLWTRPSQVRAFMQDEYGYNPAVGLLAPRYNKVSVPTVIVTGDADALVNPERHAYPLHSEMRDSELVVLPAAGHMLPHTRPEAVVNALRSAASARPAQV